MIQIHKIEHLWTLAFSFLWAAQPWRPQRHKGLRDLSIKTTSLQFLEVSAVCWSQSNCVLFGPVSVPLTLPEMLQRQDASEILLRLCSVNGWTLKRQVPFDVNHITSDVSWCLVGLLSLRIWLLWDLRRWVWCMFWHSLAPEFSISQKALRERLPRSSKCQHRYRRFSGDLTKHWGKLQQSTGADLSCCEMLWSLPPSCSWVRHWEEQLPVLTQWEAPAVQPLQPQSSPTQLVQLLVQEQADSPPKVKMWKVNPMFWICMLLEQRTEFWTINCYHLSILQVQKRATSTTSLCESPSLCVKTKQ